MFKTLCLIHLTYTLSKKQEHRKEKPRELKHVLVNIGKKQDSDTCEAVKLVGEEMILRRWRRGSGFDSSLPLQHDN